MSLNLQGSEYLSAREAGELFGYSPDYVSRLCRNGQVRSQRVGKAWFVEHESLKAFSLKSELEAEERKAELRAERINEIKDSITIHAANSSNVSSLGQYGLQAARVAAFVLGVSAFIFFTATSGALGRLENNFAEIISQAGVSLSESNLATAITTENSLSSQQKNTTTNFSQGIPWYERAWRFITSLFVRDEIVVVTPPVKVQPVVLTPVATTTTVVVREPVRVVQQPAPAPTTVIENITRSVILSGVSQTELASALTNLENKLRTTLSGITQVVGNPTPYYPAPSFGGIANTIALLNNIDKLANVEITGGSIT
ncbi:helix-turn-helix domain-containing protein, partial [Patescibacteria group bacterium]|nr:helix-turn-helix domain-containing protein [Patescibacteria group bacterium]